MSGHLMLDIETLGTKPGCIVLTLGAAKFDPLTGALGSTFYEAINFKSSVLAGLKCEPNTYAWWQKQSAESRKAAFAGETELRDAMSRFAKWAHTGGEPQHWWSQGSDFDFPILEAAFRAVNMQAPWRYWAKRDTRTAYAIAGFDSKEADKTRQGTYHNALDDSLHQIKCVHASYVKIGLGTATKVSGDDEVVELDL